MARTGQIIEIRNGTQTAIDNLTSTSDSQIKGEPLLNTTNSTLNFGTGPTAVNGKYHEPAGIDGRILPQVTVGASVAGADLLLVSDITTGANKSVTIDALVSKVSATSGDTYQVKPQSGGTEGFLGNVLTATAANGLTKTVNSTNVDLAVRVDTSTIGITSTYLEVLNNGITASKLANTIDMAAAGKVFNATKVNGASVNASGVGITDLWHASKIIDYVQSYVTSKTSTFIRYAMDELVTGSIVSKKLQIGGNAVEFATTGTAVVALNDKLLLHTPIGGGYTVPYAPVIYKCTGAEGTISPDWEVDTSIIINETLQLVIDNTITAVSSFATGNFLYFIDVANGTGPVYGLYKLNIVVPTAGNGLELVGNAYRALANPTNPSITVASAGLSVLLNATGGLTHTSTGIKISGISGGTI